MEVNARAHLLLKQAAELLTTPRLHYVQSRNVWAIVMVDNRHMLLVDHQDEVYHLKGWTPATVP